MIRTILVDDEPDSIAVLLRLLKDYCPQVEIVGTADGVETALQLIRSTDPDLVFLDIEMMQGNAFDLLNRLSSITFQIIFVTAFEHYAIKAFKYSAVDYLLKPVDIDDLRNAVARSAQRSKPEDISQVKMLLENFNLLNLSGQKVAIPTLDGLIFIPMQSIVRLEAKGSYSNIHLDSGETVMTTRGIKEYEDLLPVTLFFRIHNSHIINLNKIQKYQKGRGGYAVMEDGTAIEIAIRRKDDFLRRMLK